MSNKGLSQDASALLYLVPFAASGVYALYLWVLGGVSPILPATVYLKVTRDPILFVVGSLSVMLGVAIEVSSTDQAGRSAKLDTLGNTLQSIAAASLILALLSAWYANGFSDVTGAATDFIVGRFGLVFPVVMVLLSYLVTAKFNLGPLRSPMVLGIVAMLLVPVSVYAFGKRNGVLGIALGLLFLVIGLALFLMSSRKRADFEKDRSSP